MENTGGVPPPPPSNVAPHGGWSSEVIVLFEEGDVAAEDVAAVESGNAATERGFWSPSSLLIALVPAVVSTSELVVAEVLFGRGNDDGVDDDDTGTDTDAALGSEAGEVRLGPADKAPAPAPARLPPVAAAPDAFTLAADAEVDARLAASNGDAGRGRFAARLFRVVRRDLLPT